MQKLVLVATIAIASINAYMTVEGVQRVMNDFTVRSIEMEEIRARHGFRPLEYYDWRQEHAKKKLLAANPHMV
jgi:hypothetical protein